MDLVKHYMSKVEHHLNMLTELEFEYKNRPKSKIYFEKRRHNKNAAEHWKQKLLKLGRESAILVVKFDLAVELRGGVHIFKRYRALYVGVTEEMAQQLILMGNPGANNFKFTSIEPGILKEI